MSVAARPPRAKRAAKITRAAFSVPGQTAVSDTTRAPFSLVCAIEVDLPGTRIAAGTGWFFGDRMVVTAGHVLDEAGAARIRIFSAADGGRAGPPLHATSFIVGTDGDYGAAFLAEDRGASLGAFGIVDPEVSVTDNTVVLAGFDPDDGGATLWTGRGAGQDLPPDRLRYEITAVAGQSGGPVWFETDDRSLVGLHVGRFSGFNQAQRLTRAVTDQLLQWREDSERGLFGAASRVAVNWRTFETRTRGRREVIAPPLSDQPVSPAVPLDRPLAPLSIPADVRVSAPRPASDRIGRGPTIITRAGAVPLPLEAAFVQPARALDTVIVKMRDDATRSPAARFARSVSLLPAPPRESLLDTLVRNGYATKVTSVFGERGAEAPRDAFVGRAAMAAAPVRRAAGLTSVTVAPTVSAEDLAAHMNRQPGVEYAFVPAVKYPCMARRPARAQDTATRRAGSLPNDPLRARQGNHAAIKLDRARAAAGFRDAATITVAIVDSGVDEHHPDLQGMIATYVNFLSSVEDERDYQGHGTHVSGIISATINNAVGISGICAARIMMLKALPRRGGRWDAQAYYRALAHPIGTEARVLNLSLGGALDRGEQDIIADLIDAGITVVAAMGNEFEQGNPVSYPAAYDGVVAVGASDQVDRRGAFSCTGPHIALVAPGVDILSTVPSYPSEFAATLLYDSWPGTSMAAPHVAAAAGLLLARDGQVTPAQIRRRIIRSAERVRWQSAVPDNEYGAGRLNIERLLQ